MVLRMAPNAEPTLPRWLVRGAPGPSVSDARSLRPSSSTPTMSSTPRAPVTPSIEKDQNTALKPMSASGAGIAQITGEDHSCAHR